MASGWPQDGLRMARLLVDFWDSAETPKRTSHAFLLRQNYLLSPALLPELARDVDMQPVLRIFRRIVPPHFADRPSLGLCPRGKIASPRSVPRSMQQGLFRIHGS